MSKLTFKFRTSFDTTVILDKPSAEKSVLEIVKAYEDHEQYNYMPAKQKAMTGLIAQAYINHGLDAGVAEMLRYNFRTGLNDILKSDVAVSEAYGSIKPAPVKVEHLI